VACAVYCCSTSLVYANKEAVQKEPYALFCSEDKNGCHLEVLACTQH
jgi:hypothetical protein